MELLKISKRDFLSFVDKKISEKKSRIVGVIQKGSHFVFDDLPSSKDLRLDYDVTILPPKKYFQPQKEVLLKFVPKKIASCVAVNSYDPITIFGIHYYDLAAIYLMDRAFSDGDGDQHYIKKRENSLLIGSYPQMHFKQRFSKSVVKDQYYKVADLMLVDMGDEYVIEVVSEKGKNYLKGSQLKKNTYSLKQVEEAKTRIKDDQKLPVTVDIASEFLTRNYYHSVWKYFGDKCFSCGSCVFVCPTCYCFDVREEIDLTLAEGQRIKVWDGCMLEDFAVVADGHNFRKDRADRFKHRTFRKVKYLPDKYRYFGCVGCGRCADACTADIAGPNKVFKYILENQ
jgi:formate hydrogenlyase subunit 6/NADH:ubiquinone oxidoreductase subunit I